MVIGEPCIENFITHFWQ